MKREWTGVEVYWAVLFGVNIGNTVAFLGDGKIVQAIFYACFCAFCGLCAFSPRRRADDR